MSGVPVTETENGDDELDIEIDIDNLDDETLQRLLEEDPSLEEELKALDSEGTDADDEPTQLLPPPKAADDGDSSDPDWEDPPFVAAPSHDDLAEFDYDEDRDEADALDVPPPTDDAEIEMSVELEDTSDIDARPVPRIDIHFFCVSDQATKLAEQAAADRRLSKAHVTLQSGDAIQAAELYAQQGTPNLIILEAGDTPSGLLKGLDALARVCDPSTRVIVIGNINDIRLYRELMNRGVSEYLVKPRSPVQLIASISALYADPDAPILGKSYVFIGARGGSGSSTICHNVAWSIAEQHKSDTVLVDLDLAFGTAGLDFEHDPSQGLAEALAAPERLDAVLLDRLLQKYTDRLSLFVAPNLLDRDYDLPSDSFETVIDIVRNSAPSVAIDLPHVWSAWSRHIMQSADEIVITATPDLSAFRNAKNIIETVKQTRINDAPPILVLNQVGVPKRPEVPVEQFEEAIGIAPSYIIPWEPVLFGNAATAAEALPQMAPKHRISADMTALARQLLGRAPVEASSAGGFLKSLFSKRR
jgi:pilus assembly protein CpaE